MARAKVNSRREPGKIILSGEIFPCGVFSQSSSSREETVCANPTSHEGNESGSVKYASDDGS